MHNMAFRQGLLLSTALWVVGSVQMAAEMLSDLYPLNSGGQMDHVLFLPWSKCPTPAVIWDNQPQIINPGAVISINTFTRQMLPDMEHEPKLSSSFSSGTQIYRKMNSVKDCWLWMCSSQKWLHNVRAQFLGCVAAVCNLKIGNTTVFISLKYLNICFITCC